jgi:hypothetical protein
VRVVVDGWAAGVKSHRSRACYAIEWLRATGKCVMKTEDGHALMIRARQT